MPPIMLFIAPPIPWFIGICCCICCMCCCCGGDGVGSTPSAGPAPNCMALATCWPARGGVSITPPAALALGAPPILSSPNGFKDGAEFCEVGGAIPNESKGLLFDCCWCCNCCGGGDTCDCWNCCCPPCTGADPKRSVTADTGACVGSTVAAPVPNGSKSLFACAVGACEEDEPKASKASMPPPPPLPLSKPKASKLALAPFAASRTDCGGGPGGSRGWPGCALVPISENHRLSRYFIFRKAWSLLASVVDEGKLCSRDGTKFARKRELHHSLPPSCSPRTSSSENSLMEIPLILN